jgi:beta-N-acetylhexosaminidase
MTIGHVMLDLCGFDLNQLEKELIGHPQVGGIIFFSRNYESKKQLKYLIKSIRKLNPECILAVDQEGGRVQRFKNEFISLPPFKHYGDLYQKNHDHTLAFTENMAYSMALELKELGIDLTFSPVLDLDSGKSEVIGDRSFHSQPEVVVELGRAFIRGMHRAKMPATGKHFPGHGGVTLDSHLALPIDDRSFDDILNWDMVPFIQLKDNLDAVMPAHIVYEQMDTYPTCYSTFWLQEILRTKIQFTGVIFSDDLSMVGAGFIPDYVQRAEQALAAGCDMVLACNHQEEAIRVLDGVELYKNDLSQSRLQALRVQG